MNRYICFLFCFFIMSLQGCLSVNNGEQKNNGMDKKEQIPAEPKLNQDDRKKADIRELTIALAPGRIDFDPLHSYSSSECQLYTAMYEGLLTYHPLTLEPLPGIARNWEVSEDGLTYTFYLQDGLFFSNGDPLTSSDIRDSWLRMINPDKKAEYSVFFDVIKGVKAYRAKEDNDLSKIGIRATDDKILTVELDKPASHFLKLLCHMSFVPIHPKYRGSEDWGLGKSIISNGPFHMIERDDKKIVLAKNNLYWGSNNVNVDRIVIKLIEDKKEITKQFNTGLIQWALNGDFESLKDRSSLIVNPMFSTSYFFFVCDTAPYNDPRVRRGLALLLPWEDIRIKDYLFTTDTLVPRLSGYPHVKGIAEPNEDEGLSLLKDAGYGNGKDLPELSIMIGDDEDSVRIAGIMKKTWEAKLSMSVKVNPVTSDEYFDALKKQKYGLGMMSWIGDFADPLTFLQMWTSGSNLNDGKYSNSAYDKLVDESLVESGETKYGVLGKAEQILLDEAVVLPIRQHPAFNVVNTKLIEGWYPNPLDIHPFKYLRFKTDELQPNVAMR